MSKMLGYFTNSLAKLNEYIEREQKSGSDIPRFTKNQIRVLVRYLERKELFRFRHAIDCDGKRCQCDDRRRAEFIKIIRAMNSKLPQGILDTII
jgi:hypothetical protein